MPLSKKRRLIASPKNLIRSKSSPKAEAATPEPKIESWIRLQKACTRLWQTQDLKQGLQEMLKTTIELLHAEFGIIQLYEPKEKVLRIAAQKGFKKAFLDHFQEVSAKDGSACARAMRRLTRVVIKDVEKDARFAPHRHVARAVGFRAVQSTPLVSREGRLLGMISTHFRQVHRPQWEEFESLDLYALHAADFLERCKREQMLRDRENKLRLALDAARAGTWSWNAKSQEASWDTRFDTLYDLPRNHPRSTETWLERVHPNDRPALIAEIKRVTSQVGDGNWDVEFRSIHRDGRIVWHHGRGHAVCDEKGKLERLDGIDLDITERKRADDALRDSEANLQKFIGTAAVSLVRMTSDLHYNAVNQAYATLVGIPMDQIIGRRLDEVLGKRAMERIQPYVERVLRGERVEYELEMPYKVTGSRWIQVIYMPDRDIDGTIVGWVASITDITDRKKTEDALRENETRLRMAAAAGNVGLWDWDLQTNAVYFSPEWKHQLGFAGSEITENLEGWHSRLHPDDLDAALKSVRSFLKNPDKPYQAELRFRHNDGRYTWIHTRAEVLRDEKGKAIRMLGCHTDITDRKEAEQRLREANATLELRVNERTEEIRKSEEQYRLLFEWNPNPMWIFDSRTLRFLKVNEAAVKLYGWTREQFAEMTIKDIRPAHEIPKMLQALPNQGSAQSLGMGEWRHWKKDHTPMDVEVTISSIQFMGAEAWLALAKDITLRKKVEQALQADLVANKKLAELGMLSAQKGGLQPVLSAVLSAAIAITGADFGNIQLASEDELELRIVAHQGFPQWWLDFWEHNTQDLGICGKVLQSGKRLIVKDVNKCPVFAGTKALQIQRRAGVRALQCTPLVSRCGKVLGVFSTHYRNIQQPDERTLSLLDLLARQAADLIERSQSEAALRASETKYRELYETLHDAYVSVDMEGNIQEFNSAYMSMMGYSEDELRGLNYIDLTLSKWHKMEARIVRQQILPRGYSSIYEKEYRRKDGIVFPVELRTCLIRHSNGQPQGMWAIVRDITKRKEAETRMRDLNAELERRVDERTQELLQREERLRAILNTVVDAIITIDGRGTIQSVNPATEKMFGYMEAEMIGQNVKMLMPSPHREAHDSYLERFHRTGEKRVIGIGREARGQRKNGTLFPIEIAVSQVNHSEIFTGVIRDISHRRDLEKEVLKISENERASIGQDLHDDLGQQLAGIWLLCDSIKDGLSREGSAELPNATKITKLLKNALSLTRSLARGLHPVAVQAGGLANALNELASRTRTTSHIDCRFTCGQSISIEETVATHLYRIAQEAVSNAVKHTDAKSIKIELKADSESITLSVENDGHAKSKEISRLEKKPNGMGLKIMRYRADMIGAVLAMKSPTLGGGTIVVCTVPIHSPPSPTSHEQETTDDAI
jgi:PAS domain S-box-containing protein